LVRKFFKVLVPLPLRNVIRPVWFKALSLRLQFYRKFVASPLLRRIRRGHREVCWCGGALKPFQYHVSYGICQKCGCYVNQVPPLKEELSQLYSLDLYWRIKQKADGLPVIEQRSSHDKADGRVDFFIKLIQKYAIKGAKIIEVGCAHGVLLKELKVMGYNCIGVEIDETVADFTRRKMDLDVRTGLFPGIELPTCDLFLSIDVLEHSLDPEAFIHEAARLLKPGGIAIVQTVIDLYHETPPFAQRFQDAFDDLEHVFIFTDRSIEEIAKRSGFKILSLTERMCYMGEIMILQK
jgi:SAM-dependent methyltransferase